MPDTAASYMLIIGYFQNLVRYRELASMDLLRHIVGAYGPPYIQFVRDLAVEGPHNQFRSNWACILQNYWEQTQPITEILNGTFSQASAVLLTDVLTNLLHFNTYIQSIRADGILPPRCYESFSRIFAHWTISVWNDFRSPWEIAMPFIHNLIFIHETLNTRRVEMYNACIRALQSMSPVSIKLVPNIILIYFNIRNTASSNGAEHLTEISTQIDSDHSTSSENERDLLMSDLDESDEQASRDAHFAIMETPWQRL